MIKQNEPPIEIFRGEYFFLSNFYQTPIEFENKVYPSSENAYQAAKTDQQNRDEFMLHKNGASISPGEAKRLGRKVKLRENWENLRLQVMEDILRIKFKPNSYLANKLIRTETRQLIEGNTWRDTYWGSYNGKGQNNLGKILMKIRESL